MSFLTPLAFLGALIAIPIILLYMLRLRRREVVVSSNFLWQQVVRDREANTPWQRLRRNFLLILQLIILALLVLALARPAQIVPKITSGKTVILLDASASMNATDADGNTRFDDAKTEALLLLGEINIEDEVSIIRVADVAEPLISYTTDINALRTTINSAEVGQGGGDWDTALTLAAAGAEGADSFGIVIISDGGLGATAQLPENIPAPAYIRVGESRDNLSISALATRALPGQDPQLFAQVQNYADVDNEVALLVRLDGEIWESITETVSAESQRSFVFTVDEPFETAQAELVLDDEIVDYLPLDNSATTVASDTRSRRVLMVSDQPNFFLEQALRSIAGVQLFRGDPTRATLPSRTYDLYVFDGYLPETLPEGDMLIINPPTSTEIFTLTEEQDITRPIELVNRTHPVSAFLNVSNLNLRVFDGIANAEWGEALITANEQPIVMVGESRGRQILLMPFDLRDSDFPLNIAFPLMMANAMDWFSPANIISGGASYTVGDVVRINPPLDASSVRVTLPDGDEQAIDITGETHSFADTHTPGLYRVDVLQGDTVSDSQLLAVNLFGTDESNIIPVADDAVLVGGGVLDEESESQLGFREFWSVLALLAIVVMLYEWRVYYMGLRVPRTNDDDDEQPSRWGRIFSGANRYQVRRNPPQPRSPRDIAR